MSDHPAPNPNQPDALVEKVARALFDNDYGGYTPEFRESVWDDMGGSEPSEERADYVIAARTVLAAVLPEVERHAKAAAWDEGFWDGQRQTGEGDDGPRYTNPYREKGDAR